VTRRVYGGQSDVDEVGELTLVEQVVGVARRDLERRRRPPRTEAVFVEAMYREARSRRFFDGRVADDVVSVCSPTASITSRSPIDGSMTIASLRASTIR
jgi:hypothetical protein